MNTVFKLEPGNICELLKLNLYNYVIYFHFCTSHQLYRSMALLGELELSDMIVLIGFFTGLIAVGIWVLLIDNIG